MIRLTILLLFSSICCFAQDTDMFKPDSVRKSLEAVQIHGALHIDGVLNEPEWQLTKPSSRFIQVEPLQGTSPNFQTDVRVLYNKQFLYVGIFSKDSLGRNAIRATDFKRDFNVLQHDMVMLSFDGFNDQRNAMALATNAYGVQRDLLSFDDIYYDLDWDGLWKVRTTRTDSGWIAEMAIPWQTLRYPKIADSVQNWGFNIYRNRRLTNEVTAFSPYPRSFTSMRMDYAGLLKNLRPPPPKTNIRIQPYVITSYDKQKVDGIKTVSDTKLKVGGEIKWALSPNSVLDLTANTDFAQADADRQVNNTTLFSVFFPERRQFFLENASLFGIGVSQSVDESGGLMRIQPFFSRRIGLDDNGNQIPLEYGGRYVYRSSKRNYGAMLMRQKEVDASPGTNFLVARYSENFGKQNRIGTLVTVKNQPQGSNVVGSVDGFFRFGESHSVSTMVSVSNTSNTGKQGMSAYAQYYFISNKLKMWWTQSIVTKDYDPQMGFVSRTNVIGTAPGIFWWYRGKHLPFKKWLRAYEPSVFPEFYHQVGTGKLVERTWTVYPVWLNLQSGAYFGYSATPTYQFLTENFEPLGVQIAAGAYHFTRQKIYASTDPSRKLNLQTIYWWGSYFNGRLRSGDWTLQYAPSPHFSLSGRFNRNNFIRVGELNTTTKIDLYAVEGRFAINPRIQLIGFYQVNAENDSKNYNVRFSWEYQPLSYLYVVLNHREFQDLSSKTQTQDHAIMKISFLKQF